MMVPTSDYNNLVNYYKGRLTESSLLNKAGRLAAERHKILTDPQVPSSLALAMTKPKAKELGRLTKRIRTGGTTRGRTVTGGSDDDDDDDAMLVSPLEHKLDKILRATEKTLKKQSQRPLVPHTKRRLLPKTPKKQPIKPEQASTTTKSGWISSMKSGALKGLGQSMGVNVSRTSDTDSDDEGATRQKKKETHPQSGQTVACGTGMGRFYGRQTTPESSLVGLRGRGGGGRGLKTKQEGVSMCKNGWARRGSNFIGPGINSWVPGRI